MKFSISTLLNSFGEDKLIAPKLLELAKITDEKWDKQFPASALRRIKPQMLRRNARANLESSQQAKE